MERAKYDIFLWLVKVATRHLLTRKKRRQHTCTQNTSVEWISKCESTNGNSHGWISVSFFLSSSLPLIVCTLVHWKWHRVNSESVIVIVCVQMSKIKGPAMTRVKRFASSVARKSISLIEKSAQVTASRICHTANTQEMFCYCTQQPRVKSGEKKGPTKARIRVKAAERTKAIRVNGRI